MNSLRGRLIVSCQADPHDAFYGRMDLFAQAAVAGGAAGIRANGPDDVRAIRDAVSVPIVGIQKRLMPDGKVLITPAFEDAQALVNAGATAVALDCTKRGRAMGALDRLRRIKIELGVPVLADIATIEEALQAAGAGADFVLSTLRGYTEDTAAVDRFDPAFIRELVLAVRVPVIAEGRVDTPQAALEAMRAGAFAVVVGSAITRPHQVTSAFADAVEHAATQDVLGIDMGGTNTKSGLVSSSGQLLWEDTMHTPAHTGRDGLLAHLSQVAQAGIARSPHASAIGIATAGWVDPHAGRVVYATENLPGWTGTEIAVHIANATGLPVSVENDANALALGEAEFGAGRGLTDFVCITLGTGVGGGCWTNGRLNRGAHFFANALGHISIDPSGPACNCGQRGCLETYANVAALLGYADGRFRTTEELIAAAQGGEAAARNAIRELAGHLARGSAILVQLLDPQALILGGGVVQKNPLLIADLQLYLSQRVSVWKQRALRIVPSPLGYHGGVLGAAAAAHSHQSTL
jgi:N-acetylmannosamine-6-phosphate 2-epimerase/N-acetylmannosamine kinase